MVLELDCEPKATRRIRKCRQTYHGAFHKRVKTLLNYSEFALNYGCLRPIHTSGTLISMGRTVSESLHVGGKLNRQIYRELMVNPEGGDYRL